MSVAMAFFDESGKLQDSEAVVFAGCIAAEEHWVSYMQKWSERIKRANPPMNSLSMKDAMHFHNEFTGWQNRIHERDDLLADLAEIAVDHIICWVALPVTATLFKGLPEGRKKQLRNPQYMGFEAAVKAMLDIVKNPSTSLLHIYCDSSEEYAEKCLKLYPRMRYLDAETKQRCIAITFAEDQFFPPLQVADMIAYCIRANCLRHKVRPEPIVDRLLSIFERDQSKYKLPTYEFVYREHDDLGSGTIEKKDRAVP